MARRSQTQKALRVYGQRPSGLAPFEAQSAIPDAARIPVMAHLAMLREQLERAAYALNEASQHAVAVERSLAGILPERIRGKLRAGGDGQ